MLALTGAPTPVLWCLLSHLEVHNLDYCNYCCKSQGADLAFWIYNNRTGCVPRFVNLMIQMGGYTEPSGKSSLESVWKRAGTFRKCLPGDRMNHLSIMHHVDHIVPHRTLIGPNTIAWLDAWKDGVLRARELVNPAASRGKVFVVVQKHYYKKKESSSTWN